MIRLDTTFIAWDNNITIVLQSTERVRIATVIIPELAGICIHLRKGEDQRSQAAI